MRVILLGVAGLAMLAGCVEPVVTERPDECKASSYQHLIGRPLAEFDAKSVKGPLRILPPDGIMTMDYRSDRLNVHHDKAKIITKIDCV